MKEKIFYLFSSTYRELYKQDNIDVVAAPTGYVIGFRYNKNKYVHSNVLALKKKEIIGKKGLVIYVERDADKNILVFHPLRMINIKELNEIGSTYKVYLEMNDFCVAKNLDDFNKELKEKVPDLPYIEIEKGKFFTEAELVESVEKKDFISGFESLVRELKNTIHYKDAILYCIPEIEVLSPKKSDEVTLKPYKEKNENYLQLDSAKSYQLTLYHHNPDLMGFRALRVFLETDPQSIKMISKDYFEFASAYDEGRFEIYTKRVHSDRFSHLKIIGTEKDVLMPKITIPVVVKYNRFYTISSIALTALGIFLTGLSTNVPKFGWQILAFALAALIAGLGLFRQTRKD